jgi:predicted transcriptional regulator
MIRTLKRMRREQERMEGKLKNRTRYTATVDSDLVDNLKELSQKTRIPQSKLMDEAIELLLKNHNVRIKRKKRAE